MWTFLFLLNFFFAFFSPPYFLFFFLVAFLLSVCMQLLQPKLDFLKIDRGEILECAPHVPPTNKPTSQQQPTANSNLSARQATDNRSRRQPARQFKAHILQYLCVYENSLPHTFTYTHIHAHTGRSKSRNKRPQMKIRSCQLNVGQTKASVSGRICRFCCCSRCCSSQLASNSSSNYLSVIESIWRCVFTTICLLSCHLWLRIYTHTHTHTLSRTH